MFKKKKIGIALGGGGARGLAHIGVLKILEKNNIPIDMISGTSIGAVIGAFYASEPNAKFLEKQALEQNYKKLFDYTLPRSGLIKGEKIEKILDEKLQGISFAELKIPLFITAYDIEGKQEIIFNKGNVAKAVRASISIPGIFVPVENEGRILVDGGIADPIPIDILREKGADIIIAVNVNCVKEKKPVTNEEATIKKSEKKIPGIIKNIYSSFRALNSISSKKDLIVGKADFIIEINLEEIGTFDFEKAKEIIKKGEDVTRKSIKEITKITTNPLARFLKKLSKLKIED